VWKTHVSPDWPRRRALLERDVTYRAGLLAAYGWPRALQHMNRRSAWVGTDPGASATRPPRTASSVTRELAARHAGGREADRLRSARLTEREGEVLKLMTKGLSNAEIAAHLVVSVETVKTHVGNVLAKLRARDRTQAVIVAYDSGFVSPS
jgi:ATP/maltotriose-dependent transcriptional regulator MalT